MKGVQRGDRVLYDVATVEVTGRHTTGGEGLVLDRSFESGTWFVMPTGAQRAVIVRAADMRPAPNKARTA